MARHAIASRAYWLLYDPHNARMLSYLIVAADLLLSVLVIFRVPYTEIDWVAYMEQVEQVLNGERNYARIAGSTGPLVYPAFHVYIYSMLFQLTDGGKDIRAAQYIFAALYLLTLILVLKVYRTAGVPPFVLPLVMLSKRLHSIYLLRLFNDGWSTLLVTMAILCWQNGKEMLGSIAYSLAVGVKMNALLYAPAIVLLLLQRYNTRSTLLCIALMAQVQILIGLPFLVEDAQSYVSRAFELSRSFMYKWTVNWRFVGPEMFGSTLFSFTLLCLHVSVLMLFMSYRWNKVCGSSITDIFTQVVRLRPISNSPIRQQEFYGRTQYPLACLLTSNFIGILFARTLHYQFYAWFAWWTPLMLWSLGLSPIAVWVVVFLQEYAWNVFPSTTLSSLIVVGTNALIVLLSWLRQPAPPSFNSKAKAV